jgi:uncharacterized RDD family membrane protein YckC
MAVAARRDLQDFHLNPSLREIILGTMAVTAAGAIRSERAEQARNALLARAGALVADMLVFGVVSFVVNSVYGVTQITSGSFISSSSGWASYSTNTAVPWYLFMAVSLVYFTVPEALFGATPGKYLAGLRVVSVDGRRLSLGAVLARNLMRIVDYLPVIYVLGGISVRFTTNSQRLGDRLAGTTVVRREHALRPGETRSAGPKAKRIAGIALVAAFVFTFAFDYFGRPPLEIQALYNVHQLMPIGDGGYTLGSPQWSWGRVTYPVTGLQEKTGYPCTGSITLEWSAFGWHGAGAGFVCRP